MLPWAHPNPQPKRHFDRFSYFWATVCKTVRPVLSDRYYSYLCTCPLCLSATLVYCGQTAGWINIPVGTEVGLCRDHIVLDGDPVPHQKKQRSQQPPTFRPKSLLAKRSPFSELQLVRSCCTAHGRVSSGMPGHVISPKNYPFTWGDVDPHLIHGSLGPVESKSQTAS